MYLPDPYGLNPLPPSDANENKPTSDATEYGLSGAEYQHDDILGGRYRVISLLGRGGMGVVYRVEQIYLGKELALKTIDRHLMSDITVRRFQAEARAAFAVDHPNIVAVHDFGLFEDETPFLVMEIVQGETLGDRLKRCVLSIDEAIPIFIQVCFGLAHAHDSGVVHRDIKPNNIMLLDNVPEGIDAGVKILDFGIAKLAHREGGEVQALTRTGEIFGSPLYMSPEQCSGTKVDHRADVYSLGCVIFESLTGTPPFVGDTALTTMMSHQTGAIPTLKEASLGREFPVELERLVALMLAKNPADRYQNLGNAALDLSAIKRGEKSQLSAAIQPKRPVGEDNSQLVTFERQQFYAAMAALALVTFLLSSGITYITQADSFGNQRVPLKPPAVTSQANTLAPSTPAGTSAHDGTAGTAAPAATSAPAGTPVPAEQQDTSTAAPHAVSQNATVSPAETTSAPSTPPATNNSEIASATAPPAKRAPNEESIMFENDIVHKATEFKAVYATDLSLKEFKNYPYVQSLNVRNSPISDAGLDYLKDSKILSLQIKNCSIDRLNNITKLPWLQILDVTSTDINDDALPKLASLKMLHVLCLANCNVTEAGLRHLTKSNSLLLLYLTPDKYSEAFINELSDKMPHTTIIPYRKKCKIQALADAEKNKDRYIVIPKLIEVAEKANKDAAATANLYVELSTDKFQRHLLKEWRALGNKALALAERSGDYTVLNGVLEMQAGNVGYVDHDRNKSLAMNDRAEHLFVDTSLHASSEDLLRRLLNFTNLPLAYAAYDQVIDYCKTAIGFIEQTPALDKDNMLPAFVERIAWCYIVQDKKDLALPYCQKTLALTTPRRDADPMPYWRALIEYSHCLGSDFKKRKELYVQAIEGLEKLKIPEALSLRQHYCDACVNTENILVSQGDRAGAAVYARKGLAAVNLFKTIDVNNRHAAFAQALVKDLRALGRDAEAKKVAAENGVKFE